MIRPLILIALIAFSFCSQAQNFNNKVSKAVQKVYSEYKLFFDSSLLSKYVVLDRERSYLVNAQTQKIRSIIRADDAFAFDEFSLTFAFVYKGDTIRRFPACRLDTMQNLMALGTPSNPVRHGDVLPPFQELVKGNIKFDYKDLKKLLQKKELQAFDIDLKIIREAKKEFVWHVVSACPEIKCRTLIISALNGKIIADGIPE